ncbi:unnamed protein product [Vitrella brassicaformis CCMP3155]|uniref:Thioredoxin domain-containing protein n=1 Tax=Vitrella brassicaformis (strain CCMP3155) TaxID=1169540 RepID=A0A0G4G0U1_VITBC|nr:unnamed protein product [Vitrella brassicaformis CCMP3155]|mmetsp:Transcript_11304/g.27329  ORF Transcript_11304/g.27329 Transcript_11304/m.27329 type:complete len:121 (+) Transcript_11304:101-463(+)|eukprot:CEM21247.1 unnamed protein product [Vitrella brassicaformis CCMP3155]
MPPKIVSSVSDEETFKSIVFSNEDPRLHIVDVYTQWCGPCNQMMPLFKSLSINVDFFEERVNILQVCAATIGDFEKYEGTSQPTFLLYREGSLVAEVKGANAPVLLKTIDQNLPPPPDTD